jgi:hypothetical protein
VCVCCNGSRYVGDTENFSAGRGVFDFMIEVASNARQIYSVRSPDTLLISPRTSAKTNPLQKNEIKTKGNEHK